MTKILVVSDSHKHNATLNQIFNNHKDIDTCIHCGDLQDDKNNLHIRNLMIVSGNNDFNLYDDEILCQIENLSVFICHGHLYQIEDTKRLLEETALEKKTQLVLFGHTHHPEFYEKDGIHYLNPGSVAFPRGGKVFVPTYAIIEIGQTLTCHFYHAKTHEDVSSKVLALKEPKKTFFSRFKRQ